MEEKKAIMPVSGEIVSIKKLANDMKLKEGDDLDYTTPSGIRIKAKIGSKGPTDVQFFSKGEMVRPSTERPKIDVGMDLECCFITMIIEGPLGLHIPRVEWMCFPKKLNIC